MNRRYLRIFLLLSLLVSSVFAAWVWLRPYAWKTDPAARCTVSGASVRQDLAFFWVHVHLKVIPGQTHDLQKPVRLITSGGRELEPADTTLAGNDQTRTTDLWFKFWLDGTDIEGPLTLRINDGSLSIKSTSGTPRLGASKKEFATNRW